MTQNTFDYKKKSEVSVALWIPLVWMFYSAARPISFWLQLGRSNTYDYKYSSYMEGSPVDRNILLIFIVLSIYVLSKRNIRWKSLIKINSAFVIWFFYCMISISWSDYPFVSLKRWIKEFGSFLSILIVLTEANPSSAVKALLKRFSYIVIPSSIILILFFPNLGISGDYFGKPSYAGVAYSKNGLGAILLVSGFFFFYNIVSMKRVNPKNADHKTANKKESVYIQYIFLAVTLYMLSIVHSATSFGGFLIGVFVYIAFGLKLINRNLKFIWAFSIIAIFTGVVLQYSLDVVDFFVTSLGRELTLTGRTSLWKDLLMFREDPLIGVGYGNFWLGERLDMIWELRRVNEAHNGYLFVYLELGIIGLLLLAGIILNTYRNINRELLQEYDYGRFQLALLIVVILYNVTEEAFAQLHLIWFVLLLIGVSTRQKPVMQYSHK